MDRRSFLLGSLIIFAASRSASVQQMGELGYENASIDRIKGKRYAFRADGARRKLLLQQGRAAMADAVVAVHVIGSVTMTFLGIGSYTWANGA
jgi:hypothetical protein